MSAMISPQDITRFFGIIIVGIFKIPLDFTQIDV